MHLANYLQYLVKAETNLAEGFRKIGEAHAAESDIFHTADTLAQQCEAHAEQLQPFCEEYGKEGTPSRTASTTSSLRRPARGDSVC
jgi:hypothetical protein